MRFKKLFIYWAFYFVLLVGSYNIYFETKPYKDLLIAIQEPAQEPQIQWDYRY